MQQGRGSSERRQCAKGQVSGWGVGMKGGGSEQGTGMVLCFHVSGRCEAGQRAQARQRWQGYAAPARHRCAGR